MDGPFTKTSLHPTGRLRLRNELVRLRQAQHPAVVQVSNFEDGEERTRLEFVRGGTTTIAESPPELPELALAFIAATARTVGDLHDIGLAHRRLTGDHIIVTPEGHPLLCGFADATMPASAGDLVADQRSLSALVDLLAQSASSAGRHARAAKALRTLAGEVAQSDGTMSAAALATRAAKLAGRHPVASTMATKRRATPLAERLAGARRGSQGSRWIKPTGAGLIAAVVILIVIVALAGGPGSGAGDASQTTTSNLEFDPRVSPTTSPASTSSSPTAIDLPETDVDTPAVRFQAGGATFAAGEAGDEVYVGD